MSDWRSRAAPINADYGQPVELTMAQNDQPADWLTQLTTPAASADDWKTRAQPVQAADWRSRAQVVETPKPSVAGDLTKSIGSNLLKGGVDAAMWLPNIANAAVAGPQYLAKGIKDTFEGNPTDRSYKPYQPFFSSEDVVADSAIDYKPQTKAGQIAEMPARLMGNLVGPKVIKEGVNATAAAGEKFIKSPTTKALVADEAGIRPTVEKPVVKTSADLADMSSAAYKQADDLGVKFTPKEVTIPFSKAIAEIKPRPIAGATLTSEEKKLVQHLAEYDGLKGKPLTFAEVNRLDQGLTAKINANFIDARTGQPDANGRALMMLQTKLRNALDDIPENAANNALTNARKLYKAKIIVNDLDTIAERASMASNVGTALRTGYKNLYLDKDRTRGWPKEALELLKKAATPTITDDALQLISSRLPAMIMGGTGNLSGAATAHIVGAAGRGAKAGIAAKQGSRVQQSIVDDALGNLREVKVPEKSNIPLMLSSPEKMSRLPMSDTEVTIAQKLMEQPKPGPDLSGGAIKPPVSQKVRLESLSKRKQKLLDGYSQDLIDGTLSQNKFVQSVQNEFGMTSKQARALAKEIKTYGEE